ncbi:PHB depolymerase family esterase [Zoogloea sp. LCSB751]|uniref:extracellular catalytic domain type 2 short-chain-length polyhydroxyalkanoate depolymerase n=1 Tax=Zoogloea sp. LCSB751 TaxID=1965277 RepID=UPI0009A559FD|nr:PHB depolymerase family esterase [Zoogloea sp. LCSB751]
MHFVSLSSPSAAFRLAVLLGLAPALQAAPLPELNVDLSQTTVSGISSGAFMAVQMGVAHSAAVKGVAATAGGPYFCALQDALGGAGVSRAIRRCMQGDPDYGVTPITADTLAQMQAAARAWSARGLVDPVDGLAGQTVWLFHGYNDGIVKKPANDALRDWYGGFTPASQVFYKDDLNAGHAQISAACADASSGSCNPCAQTGGKFINACADKPGAGGLYDAAGAALQLFYGPLQRTVTAQLGSSLEAFEQTPFTRDRQGAPVMPIRLAMGDTGYVYVPQACKAGEPCRLHIAFHGCMQDAGSIGSQFAAGAGFNEWADRNRIVVLYPQAQSTITTPASSSVPTNPMGCWDWWGYNDFLYDTSAGRYAQKGGAQIAAVWRMAEKLAARVTPVPPSAPEASVPALQVVDRSARQVALVWTPVVGAAAYRVTRASGGAAEVEVGKVPASRTNFVDGALSPDSAYRYRVSAELGSGDVAWSAAADARTATLAPACDPYFSLAKNTAVTKSKRPTTKTCP